MAEDVFDGNTEIGMAKDAFDVYLDGTNEAYLREEVCWVGFKRLESKDESGYIELGSKNRPGHGRYAAMRQRIWAQ